MQASLTYPPDADLISGDNPVYIGDMDRGESRTVNWTLVFTASGVFDLDVNASGYNRDTGAYVEKHGSATVTVIDATPPAISILCPQNTTYPTSDVSLIFTVNETTDWIGYSLDGQANVTITGNTTLIGLSNGPHHVTVYANDTSGNMGSDEVYFTVDLALDATIDIDPDTLNLMIEDEWITAYIELPEDYNASDIDVSSMLMNGNIPVDSDSPVEIGDYDEDGITDLMVRFNTTAVIQHVHDNYDWSNIERKKPLIYKATLTITGKLYYGKHFEGSDIMRTLKFLKGHPTPK